jgi:hypothetical protein
MVQTRSQTKKQSEQRYHLSESEPSEQAETPTTDNRISSKSDDMLPTMPQTESSRPAESARLPKQPEYDGTMDIEVFI